jgi:biopolymer transport protein ExbD
MLLTSSNNRLRLFPPTSGTNGTISGYVPSPLWSPSLEREKRIHKRRSQYICHIDLTGLLSIFLALFFIVEILPFGSHVHYYASVDLPTASHPVPLPAARREDSLCVVVTRDGRIFFNNRPVFLDELPDQIRQGIRDGAENRIYVSADARAMYRDVKLVLDNIRLAGVQRVSFFTEGTPQEPAK